MACVGYNMTLTFDHLKGREMEKVIIMNMALLE